ncbi:hypothetical protein N1851_033041 [Merluccius polli]|uniref:Reverse transcriptase domain-containing protein n=1 Tax=Merluccius polli TaxID=89951 RepID=A0AA47NP10_MERPO|nr:hypothetical protein N1851_033041 [Merluccius polli]
MCHPVRTPIHPTVPDVPQHQFCPPSLENGNHYPVSRELTMQTAKLMDPMQFAYRASRGVEDATLTLLDKIFCHLNNPTKTYVRVLFMDFSSAFNMVQPHLLLRCLCDLNTLTDLGDEVVYVTLHTGPIEPVSDQIVCSVDSRMSHFTVELLKHSRVVFSGQDKLTFVTGFSIEDTIVTYIQFLPLPQ